MGWIGLLASSEGILRSTLPFDEKQKAISLLGEINNAKWMPSPFIRLVEEYQAYFKGQNVSFSAKLDLSNATVFQREVWEMTRSVPHNETRSYGWIAQRINKPQAARAVGQALGKNPLPIIIPCHRIISSGGELCGFSGGLDIKKLLLALETKNKG